MYFANMYCYGYDNDVVGITGIVGCIGAIYVAAGAMYAVHIPDHGRTNNLEGGKTFATWVKNQEQQVGKGNGSLFVFCNGTNRSAKGKAYSTTEEEAKAIRKGLNSPPTTVIRVMKHLGPNSGTPGALSVAVMLERVHATTGTPSGCVMWYKPNDDIQWIDGGKAESGQYTIKQAFKGAKVPTDLNAHWWRVSESNCTLATI